MIRGVFVGINSYTFYPQSELHGCVNDTKNLRALLKPKDYAFLVDGESTDKRTILESLQQIRANVKPGDHFIYTHSSHGMDEGLCCSDLQEKGGGWDPETFLSYLELGAFFDDLPEGVTGEIIIDACHTQQGVRSPAGSSYRKVKFIAHSKPDRRIAVPDVRRYLVRFNVCMWGACEPSQTSADAYIDGQYCGAFTHAFLKSCQPGRSRSDIIFYAREWLKNNRYAQTPRLYCWHDLAMEPML